MTSNEFLKTDNLRETADIEKTLESIELEQSEKNKDSVLENILTDKSKSLKATVKALLQEIKNREKLNVNLLGNLDDRICELHSEKMNMESINTYYCWDNFLEIDKIIRKIDNDALMLESEKRKEYLECWRDLMFLKKYLMSALKEYWEAVKRRALLR